MGYVTITWAWYQSPWLGTNFILNVWNFTQGQNEIQLPVVDMAASLRKSTALILFLPGNWFHGPHFQKVVICEARLWESFIALWGGIG